MQLHCLSEGSWWEATLLILLGDGVSPLQVFMVVPDPLLRAVFSAASCHITYQKTRSPNLSKPRWGDQITNELARAVAQEEHAAGVSSSMDHAVPKVQSYTDYP